MVSLMPRQARSAPLKPIQNAPTAAPAIAIASQTKGAGRCDTESAAQVAASPPSTTAPSPPMMTSPSCAGSATQSAVSSRGEARTSVFCTENQLPNAPFQTRARKSAGDTPSASRNSANRPPANTSAASGMTVASSARRRR